MGEDATLSLQLKEEISAGIASIKESLGGLKEASLSVGQTMIRVLGGNLLASGVEKLIGGFKDLAGSGLGFNNQMEQVSARINAFTKDGALTQQILQGINKEASTTPFEFAEMADSTAALLPVAKQSGLALDDLLKKAEVLAASNPAEGLTGAAFALKEAAGGDFTSIIERFNLSRQYINQLKEQGVPAMEAVSKAMQQMGLDTDLVTGLANTASGRWSTFQDTITNVAATASRPIFDAFSNGLATVNDWLSQNQPLLDQVGNTIATVLTGALQTLGPVLMNVVSFLGPFIQGFLSAAAAIAQSDNPIQTLLELLDTLLPGLSATVQGIYDWGVGIAQQLGAGIMAGAQMVVDALSYIGEVITYWLQPNSPPKIVPDLDKWGTSAAQIYLDAWGTADYSALNDMGTQVQNILNGIASTGGMDQQDVIPRVLGTREAITQAFNDLMDFGEIAGSTLDEIRTQAGPAADSVLGLLDAYNDVAIAQAVVADKTADLTRAQDELNRVSAEYDAAIAPLSENLKGIQARQREIKDAQEIAKLNEDLKNGKLKGADAELARLRIQEIGARKELDAAKEQKDAAVSIEQAKVDAAKAEQDRAQAALKQANDQLATQKAAISNYNEQNALISQQRQLLTQLADQANRAAEAAAKGAAGPKGGGGRAGAGAPKISMPTPGKGGGINLGNLLGEDTQKTVENVKNTLDDAKKKFDEVKQTITNWRVGLSNDFTIVNQKIEPFRSAVETVFNFIVEHKEAVLGAIAGIGAALAAPAVIGAVGAIGAAIAGISLPLVALVAAAAALGAAWASDFGGIRTATMEVWEGSIKPALTDLANWLAVNIPVAIQAASDFWNTTLYPALEAVATFIATTVIPAIGNLITWLATNIPVAIQAASDFWTNTLWPAIQAVSDFITNTVIPTVTTLAGEVFGALVAAGGTVSDFWTGTLQPAFQVVSDIVSTVVIPVITALANVAFAILQKEGELIGALFNATIKPAFEVVSTFISGTLAPVVGALVSQQLTNLHTIGQAISDFWTGTLQPAIAAFGDMIGTTVSPKVEGFTTTLGGMKTWLGYIKTAVQDVIKFLNDLASAISAIKIPSWLQGHSPPPMAHWLDFIAESSNRAAKAMTGLDASIRSVNVNTLVRLHDSLMSIYQDMSAVQLVAYNPQLAGAVQDAIGDYLAGINKYSSQIEQVKRQISDIAKQVRDERDKGSKADKDKIADLEAQWDVLLKQLAGVEAMQTAFDAVFNLDALQQFSAAADEIRSKFGTEVAAQIYQKDVEQAQKLADMQAQITAAQAEGNTLAVTYLTEQRDLMIARYEAERQQILDTAAAAQQAQNEAMAEQERQRQERQQQALADIQALAEAQRRANLDAAASLLNAQRGALDRVKQLYRDAFNQGDLTAPDAKNLTNEELQLAMVDYQKQVAGQGAKQQDALAVAQQVQAQLQQVAEKAADIAQTSPQAAADYYALQKGYVLDLADLQQQLREAGSDQERAIIQQQIAMLNQEHALQEQLFNANMDKYSNDLEALRDKILDQAKDTGDTVLYQYADQLTKMLEAFEQGLKAHALNLTSGALGADSGGLTGGFVTRGAGLLTANAPTMLNVTVVIQNPAPGTDLNGVEEAGYRGAQRAIDEFVDRADRLKRLGRF